MFATNPFGLVSGVLPPLALQVYIVLVIAAVIVGTLFDVAHLPPVVGRRRHG